MNAIETYEKMLKVKGLWLKNEPYNDEEIKQVKSYLFEYYLVIENKLKEIKVEKL